LDFIYFEYHLKWFWCWLSLWL